MVRSTNSHPTSIGGFLESLPGWSFHGFLLTLFVVVSPLSGFTPFTVGGVGIRFTWLVGILIVGVATYRAVVRKRVTLSAPVLFALVWFGWTVITGVVPLTSGNLVYVREYIFGVARYGLFVGATVAVTNMRLTERDVFRVFRVLATVATIVSLYAVYQFFARQYGLPFAYLQLSNPSLSVSVQVGSMYYTGGVFARVTSVFVEPSWLGMYLLTAIIVVMVPLLYRRSTETLFASRSKNIAVLSILLLAFVLAYSLGAYGSLVMVLPVFLYLDWPRVRSSFVETLAPPIVLYVAFDAITERGRMTVVIVSRGLRLLHKVVNKVLPVSIGSGTRFLEDSEPTGPSGSRGEVVRSSFATRAAEVQSSLDVWAYHPILGVGTNNFQFYSWTGKPAISFGYTLVLAEEGVVGLGLFFAFFGYLLHRLFKASGGFRPQSLDVGQVVLRTFFYVVLADLASAVFRLQFHLLRFWFYVGLAIVALLLFTDSGIEIELREFLTSFR